MADSTFWTFHSNDKGEIQKVIRALVHYQITYKDASLEFEGWITKLCEENGYDKLIGYDLSNFVRQKRYQFDNL